MEAPIVSSGINSPVKLSILWPSLVAWICIALLTYCGFVMQVNLVTISSLYLLVVVAVASLWGFWPASLTSLLAVACLDYFLMPPLFRFNVADPQDWAALGAFEATALVISRLSAKEIRSAAEATFHRIGMEKLYELSRNSVLLDLHQPPGPQLAILIHRIFGVRAVALFDKNLGHQDRMGDWADDELNLAQECCLRNANHDDRNREISQRIVQDASGPLGALVVRGNLSPLVVDALASLAAIAFDRYQSFAKEERADAARRGEQLRAAVMDALGHELKTPLTTVQTASSGLLELGGLSNSQHSLVKLIDDETLRLNKLCTRLLLTAKLDAEQVGLETSEVNFKELLAEVLMTPPIDGARDRIEIAIDDPSLTLCVDRNLLAMVLAQYIDNARKYSAPGSPITVAARTSQTEAIISVHNIGSTVRIEDRERIFDRFYRALDLKDSVPGTGIGLSVVKKAAEAHQGHVWVTSNEKEGTTFFLSLPIFARRKR
ncbi:MAG: ATP-binding protein [Terracidiphilus sp.]|jgi:two-component system sensor histidine kinase KdpD